MKLMVVSAAMLPRGPSTIVWPMLHYILSPYGALPALARKYGDPFHLPIPGTRGTIVTGDPEGIKTVMSADPDTYTSFKTEATELVLGEHSLFFQSGPAHKASRKILSQPFHASRVPTYARLMERIASSHLAAFRQGRVYDLKETTGWISLEVVIRAIFGISDEARVKLFHDTIIIGLESMGPAVLYFKWLRHEFGGVGPWARAQRMVARLRALIDEEIENRRAAPGDGDDVLTLMLKARFDDGTAMGPVEIRDKLYDMIIAGYETSAVAIAWAAYEVCRAPAVLDRLTAELDSLGAAIDQTALLALPYLDAVCFETLRLHPNFILLTRLLARPLELKGYTIPAGMGVSAAIGLAHFREETFAGAREFRPERFLGRAYTPFEYLPFGGGVQRCIGAAFAMCQMKVVLATLLRSYRLEPASKRPLGHAARSVTVGPSGGVKLRVLAARRPAAGARAESYAARA